MNTVMKMISISLAAIVLGLTGTLRAEKPTETTMSITAVDAVKWQEYPPMPGIKVANIFGNPREAGPYTVRVWFSPGTMSRPHSHPETRYITVLKGTWWGGAGPNFDPEATTPIPTGSFVVHHPNQVHYDGAKDEEVIVQISGIGPSGTNFANPADDPKNKK